MLNRDGCSIYEDRPTSCRAFECLWLMGFGSEGHRPDRSNLVLHVETSDRLGQVVVVNETKVNGARSLKAKQVLKKLKQKNFNLYIRKADGTLSLQGSEEFMVKAREVIAAMNEEHRSKVRLKVLSS